MDPKLLLAVAIRLAAAFVVPADAATLYVWPNGGQVAPYASWATAARIIQDAVDVSVDGDVIVVTNGTYLTGGRPVGTNAFSNRVAVDRRVTLLSVNGPQFTIIDGQKAVRCVDLATNATLSGFTITNGLVNSSGGGVFCEASAAVVSNCIVIGNVASNSFGGGTYGGIVNNCILTGNAANYGGGVCYGALNNCVISSNRANLGGGAYSGSLTNCALTKNSAQTGGGADSGTLQNCTVTGNSAISGGGVYGGTLRNCLLYYNIGPSGNYDSTSTLNYCCTTPLPASGTNNLSAEPQLAGAWHLCANSPCIGRGSYDSVSGVDMDGQPWANPPSIGCDEYSNGSGALSVAFVTSYTTVAVGFPVTFQETISGQVSASSWNFGDGTMVSNRPYASHAWGDAGNYTVALRAYNNDNPGGVATSVTISVVTQPVHYVVASGSSPITPYSSWASAANNIQAAVDAATVPGALVLVSNGLYQTGSRLVYGMSNRVAVTRPLVVSSVNGPTVTSIAGYRVPTTTNGAAAVRCVYLTNGAVLAGFTLTNGATQVSGDQTKQMSGGAVYCDLGSTVVSNCVLTGSSAFYRGGGACFGTLNNCTLTGNTAGSGSGGGAYLSALSNCILRGNSATYGGGVFYGTLDRCTLTNNSAIQGAGAYFGTLNNCTLMGNSASGYSPYGGGAYYSTLNNCTVSSNSALGTWPYGGGAYNGTAYNSILYFNTASNGANYYFSGQSPLNYCCTTPYPGGVGNIASTPLFVNSGAGNFRLQNNSPCINSGNNAGVAGSTDLDGDPRVVSGTVDMGAYEFQGTGSLISYAWLQQYGLPTDGSADFADPDQDGVNNYQEWLAGTDPTDASSVFKITSATTTRTFGPPAGFVVTWVSQNTRMYYLQRSKALGAPGFSTIEDNIVGQAGSTSYTDTNAVGPGPFFYRVGVKSP